MPPTPEDGTVQRKKRKATHVRDNERPSIITNVPSRSLNRKLPPAEPTKELSTGITFSRPPQMPTHLRRAELWFSDGNVVIVAADKVSFKVHSSILEQCSTGFKELLAKPTRSIKIEGCRAFSVPENGSAMAELLQILYPTRNNFGSSSFFDRTSSISFERLRKITLTASRYGVERVVTEAIWRLGTVFPITWLGDRVQSDSYCVIRQGSPGLLVKCKEGDCLAAVKLARAIDPINPPPFIVMALYFCCQLRLADLAEKVSDNLERHATISTSDFKVCLVAVEKLLRANARVKSTLLEVIAKPACGSQPCQLAKQSLVCKWNEEGYFASTAALDACPSLGVQGDDSVCQACQTTLKDTINSRRAAVFNGLAGIFGLESSNSVNH